MSTRSLDYTPYIPERPSRMRRLVEPMIERFSRRKEYTIRDRRAALRHIELLFSTQWHGPVPSAPVIFRPPASGPLAEEFANEPDPAEAFRCKGPVAGQIGLQAYFNGWKMSSEDELRMSALVHEFAHLLLAQAAYRKKTRTYDEFAYICAAEGIAMYAEKEWLRASGYKKRFWKKALNYIREAASNLIAKLRPRPEIQKREEKDPVDDEYTIGTAFFEAVSGRVGVPRAFHLLSSSLPRSMDEVLYPNIYLHRTLSEYDKAN